MPLTNPTARAYPLYNTETLPQAESDTAHDLQPKETTLG